MFGSRELLLWLCSSSLVRSFFILFEFHRTHVYILPSAWWNWNRKSKAKKKTGGDPSFNYLTKKINETKLSSSDPNYPFEGIKNFRDPADQITSLKSGKLYRTGNPSNGTEKDVSSQSSLTILFKPIINIVIAGRNDPKSI
jgi:hypothetical protein